MSELKLRPPSQLPQGQLFKLGHYLRSGSGVIWNGIPFETLVIPAKAGIQSVGDVFPMACGVDFRFRGNDCTRERPCLANDISNCGLDLGPFALAALGACPASHGERRNLLNQKLAVIDHGYKKPN